MQMWVMKVLLMGHKYQQKRYTF